MKIPEVTPRKEIVNISKMMENVLREKEPSKSINWIDLSDKELVEDLISHTKKLMFKVVDKLNYPSTKDSYDIVRRAVHIANYAMMIVDKQLKESANG